MSATISISTAIELQFDKLYTELAFENIQVTRTLRLLLKDLEVNCINEAVSEYTTEAELLYDHGVDVGYENGYDHGKEEGRTEGYDDGYEEGKYDGHTEGYDEGQIFGEEEGYELGYSEKCQDKYEEGFIAGYDQALTDMQKED
jgi:flagellar biosynthesis/type III secretory pathway protein FliH